MNKQPTYPSSIGSKKPKLLVPFKIIGTLSLIICLLCMSFALCTFPSFPTKQLSLATSNADLSPFNSEELSRGALATKDYVLKNNNVNELKESINQINKSAEARDPQAYKNFFSSSIKTTNPNNLDDIHVVLPDGGFANMNLYEHTNEPLASESQENTPSEQGKENISPETNSQGEQTSEQASTDANSSATPDTQDSKEPKNTVNASVQNNPAFTYDDSTIAYLDQLHQLAKKTKLALFISLALVIASIIYLVKVGSKKAYSSVLKASAIILIVLLVFSSATALLNISSITQPFTHLILPQTNYAFTSDMLISCIFTPRFLLYAGLIGSGVTMIFAIISLIIGRKLAK